MSTHGFELGALDLATGLAHEDGYTLSVYREGATFGSPQAVVREIVSMLADGNHVKYDRAGNRVATFDVEIKGADGVALQAGEVALRRELYKPNLLTWTPPADFSPPSVYEVVTSEMAPKFDDIAEILHDRRVFRVTLTCKPFARTREPVTVQGAAPPPVTPVTVTINAADTTTGFSATRADYLIDTSTTAVTVTDQGTYVQATASGYWLNFKMSVAITPTPLAATRYLMVEASGSPSPQFSLTLNGIVGRGVPVLTRSTDVGTVLYVFDCGTATISGVLIGHAEKSSSMVTRTINIHDISATNTFPVVSARQITRVAEVGGTERTPGSLRISSPDGTSALQLLIAATWPESDSGFSPPLRRWRVSGNTVTGDSNTFSGGREPLYPSFVTHDIPIASLPPRTYQLMALVRAASAGTYALEAGIQSRHDGVTLGETTWGAGGTETYPFPIANDWTLVPMGVYRVPIVAAKAGEFRVQIRELTTTELEFDEAWLFPVDDDCALTAVLTDKPNLWLDSADLDTRVPKLWEGTSADKSDAHWPGALFAMGSHVFTPDRTAVFVASFGVDYPEAELTYFPRGHSNAPGV